MAPPTNTTTQPNFTAVRVDRPKPAATDLAASKLIAFMRANRANPKANGTQGPTVPYGPRALKRMPTQALVAETIRRIGNQGRLTANDQRHLGAEFDRRGLDHAAHAILDDKRSLPEYDSLLDENLSRKLADRVSLNTSNESGVKQYCDMSKNMMGQVMDTYDETNVANKEVVKEPLSDREQDADLADVGLPASVIGAVAFVATHRKDELPELMSQQAEMTQADNAPTSDLSAEAEMEDAQNMSM